MTTRATMCVVLAVLWLTACVTASTEPDPTRPAEAAEVTPESEPSGSADVSTTVPEPEDHVARSAFTSRVVDREPQDRLTTLGNHATRIYYFTEIRNLEGKTVIHRWEYGDQSMGDIAFDIMGPRWRVYSVKSLDPSWLGQWTVKVVDVDGTVLSKDQFNYTAAEIDSSATASEDEPVPPAAPSAE